MSDAVVLRADAARNRAVLLAAASAAFAEAEEPPSMRAVAVRAGVGVGTLYRHFPTREALVDAVYRDQAERLTAGARDLLGQAAPAEALRRWTDLFATWVATKRGMLGALLVPDGPRGPVRSRSRAQMLAAIGSILDAGARAGDLRSDVDAEDVVAALVGLLTATGGSAAPRRARLLDVLVDGLRPPR